MANAGVVLPSASVLQGPGSRTTLVGPEGNIISSAAPGGAVVTASGTGVVAHYAPLAYSSYSEPVAYSAPYGFAAPIGYSAPVSYSATYGYSAPIAYSVPVAPVVGAHGTVNTVVSGPSGTVAASRSLNVADVLGYKGYY